MTICEETEQEPVNQIPLTDDYVRNLLS